MNEKGMVLPTVLVLMMMVAGLVTGTAFITRNQVRQLTLTQNSYKVKTMAELAEQTLEEQLEKNPVEQMTIRFNHGTVTIQQKNETTYRLSAYLEDGMKVEKEIKAAPMTDEPIEETEEEERFSP